MRHVSEIDSEDLPKRIYNGDLLAWLRICVGAEDLTKVLSSEMVVKLPSCPSN